MTLFGVIGAGTALVVSVVVPATAAAAGPTLTLAPTVGPPTTVDHANGAGYPAADSVTVTFDSSTVATATTNAAGMFAVSFPVPASATPGAHAVAAFDPAGLGAGATFVVQTNWGSSRFDPAGSGFNPFENVLSPSNVATLSELVAPSWGGSVRSEPIYAGGNIYVGSTDRTVRAFSTAGRQLWSFRTAGPVVGSPLALNGGSSCQLIVAGDQSGMVYGINPAHGARVWSFAAGAPISVSVQDPTAVEDVYVATTHGTLFDLNGCTGGRLWSYTENSPGPINTPSVLGGVKVANGTTHQVAIVAGQNGETICLDTRGRLVLWSVRDPGPTGAPPAAYGSGTNARVVVADGSSVVELNAGTGAKIWSRPTGGPVNGVALERAPGPAGAPSAVIVADTAGDLYSLNPATGKINWGDRNPGPAGGPPAVANGVIYLTTAASPAAGATLEAVNAATGAGILQADELNPQPYPPGPPSVGDGKVFVGDDNGGFAIFTLPS
jgi:outer membrane protein assembly factor BamB